MTLKEKLSIKKIEYLSGIHDQLLSNRSQPNSTLASPPLFIIGSGRNGSTLISSILNNHSKIFIPPENGIIPFAIKLWYTSPISSWDNKVDRVFTQLAKPSMWNFDYTELMPRLKSVEKSKQNLTHLIDCIYRDYGSSCNKNPDIIWGDKTPSNTIYAHAMMKQFTGSKVLFLLRDPRAVMSSLLNANYEHYIDRLDHMIWRWKTSVKKYEEIKEKDQKLIHLLRYEDFVSDPNQKVSEIINWLGLESEDDLISEKEKNLNLLGVDNAENHQNIYKTIGPEYIDTWKSKLDKDLAQHIEKRLTPQMKDYNYPTQF